MKAEQDYIRDIAEMRTLMERSSKFLSLSGMAGIMAGIYALAGVYIAYSVFYFDPGDSYSTTPQASSADTMKIVIMGLVILILALGTAIFLSYQKAKKRGEKFWNPVARRMVFHLAIPLLAGGVLILILISRGTMLYVAPLTLIFYGLALFNAGKFTYEEVKSLGLIEIGLGLLSAWYVGYGLLFWALGFGIAHIAYGIYMHYRYEMKQLIDGLHKAFESRIRLGLMAVLAVNEMLDFNTLKDYLDVTDGNLASHIKALENEDFIGAKKTFIGKKPNTKYFMTKKGKKAFEDHLKVLEKLIKLQNETSILQTKGFAGVVFETQIELKDNHHE